MARKGKYYRDLHKELSMSMGTLSFKMMGKSQFSLAEAIKLKELLGTDMPLEELFARNDTAH